MAVTLVASDGSSAGAGTTGTAAITIPANTLPTGTASADRVYLASCSVGQPTAPSGWTELFNAQLGGGTMGASTGLRYAGVWYRDYDGVWTMPTISVASAAANTGVSGAMTLRKGAGETWSTPTSTSGSDTTSDTAASVTSTTSQAVATGGALWVVNVLPAAPGTTTAGSVTITSGGATLGTVTLAPGAVSNTTGNDASIVCRHAPVTTGGTGTQTFTATYTNARTNGCVFVSQASAAAAGPLTVPARQLTTFLPAVVRASRW